MDSVTYDEVEQMWKTFLYFKTRMSLAENVRDKLFSDNFCLYAAVFNCGQICNWRPLCWQRKPAASQCSGLLWIKQSNCLHKNQTLRAVCRCQLVLSRHRRSRFGRRSFSVAAPMVCNSFPDSLRDPSLIIDNFRSASKTHMLAKQRDT